MRDDTVHAVTSAQTDLQKEMSRFPLSDWLRATSLMESSRGVHRRGRLARERMRVHEHLAGGMLL